MSHASFLFTVVVAALLLAGCTAPRFTYLSDPEAMQRIYGTAVGDAAKPQPWEISNALTPVTGSNTNLQRRMINGQEHILVVTWKQDTTYYRNDPASGSYNTGRYPIWVTLVPELQQLCREADFGKREGLELRLRQLLGMPPDSPKEYFIEFWVKPSDLIRPCPDPEITDRSCGLAFPEEVTEAHKTWINNLRLASYYHPEWDQNYPWTVLGYTYDWNPRNRSHVGMSEFVIGNNTEVVMHAVYPTREYCGR